MEEPIEAPKHYVLEIQDVIIHAAAEVETEEAEAPEEESNG